MDRNIPIRITPVILRRTLLLTWLILVGSGPALASDDIAEATAGETAEDSAETAAEETVEDSVEAAAEETVEDSVEAAAEETVEDSVEAVAEETAEESAEAAVEETAEDSVEAATEELVEESAEEAVEESAEESAEEAAEETAEESAEEAVEEMIEEEAEESAEDVAEEEAEDEAEESAEEAAEEEAQNDAEESAEEAAEDEAGESGEDGSDDLDGWEDDDYRDVRYSGAQVPGQLYAELEEIGERDFAVRQELLALADTAQIQQLADIAELTLISEQVLGQLTGTLARFRVGVSQDIASLRSRLQRLLPSAAIDFNHGYEIAQSTAGDSATATNDLVSGMFRLPAADRNADLKIGMVDTAVDTSHSVFTDARIVSKDFLEPDQQGSEAHGTAVASLLVGRSAEFQGMLPNTGLYAASVFSRHPEKTLVATSYGLVRALEWLSEEQVDAINISLAGPANVVVARAMRALTDAGVLVVAAVGNEGPFAEPRFPAAYQNVVGVTAIDRSGRLYSLAGRGEHVDYAGPGVAVTVATQGTLDGYQQTSGTSFATPIVTGLLLHYLSDRKMALNQLESAIGDDYVDLGKPGRDALFGYGLPGRAWIPEQLRPSQ